MPDNSSNFQKTRNAIHGFHTSFVRQHDEEGYIMMSHMTKAEDEQGEGGFGDTLAVNASSQVLYGLFRTMLAKQLTTVLPMADAIIDTFGLKGKTKRKIQNAAVSFIASKGASELYNDLKKVPGITVEEINDKVKTYCEEILLENGIRGEVDLKIKARVGKIESISEAAPEEGGGSGIPV